MSSPSLDGSPPVFVVGERDGNAGVMGEVITRKETGRYRPDLLLLERGCRNSLSLLFMLPFGVAFS